MGWEVAERKGDGGGRDGRRLKFRKSAIDKKQGYPVFIYRDSLVFFMLVLNRKLLSVLQLYHISHQPPVGGVGTV